MDKKTEQKGENCCLICNKNFTRSTTLRRHIDDIHRTLEICLECNKIFLDLKSFNQHVRTEHGQRDDSSRVYCKLCDGKFSNKSNLIKHMRRVHPAENDYKSLASLKCPLCDSTFNATSKLHEHIEIEHDVHLEVVSKVFESIDEFKKWKSNTEKEDLAFFTIHRVNGNRSYYGCH